MNELSETSSHLSLQPKTQAVDGLHRQINGAKSEIKIFMNASKRIKDMEIETVTIDYLQTALQSILNELERK